jgi:IS30 family transposase
MINPLQQVGPGSRLKGERWTEAEQRKAEAMRAEGYSYDRIGAALGRPPSTVHTRLNAWSAAASREFAKRQRLRQKAIREGRDPGPTTRTGLTEADRRRLAQEDSIYLSSVEKVERMRAERLEAEARRKAEARAEAERRDQEEKAQAIKRARAWFALSPEERRQRIDQMQSGQRLT